MRTLLIAGLLASLTAFPAHAAEKTANNATYLQYCSACHGREGKGDGVASSLMQPPPIDLTKIAKQNGGEFPYMKVMETIDGRNSVRAHGDPQMPVWGQILTAQSTSPLSKQTDVRRKLMAITDYIRSIQEK